MHFNKKDLVLLSICNIKQLRLSSKLADKYLKPFRITKVVGDSKLAYKLNLLQKYQIYNMFLVLSFKLY